MLHLPIVDCAKFSALLNSNGEAPPRDDAAAPRSRRDLNWPPLHIYFSTLTTMPGDPH
jgi:hypothetical protein